MRPWLIAAAGLIALSACREEAPAPEGVAAASPQEESVAAEAACAPGEMRFDDLGVCGKKSADGCYVAGLAPHSPTAEAAPAGEAFIDLVNEGSDALYLVVDPASGGPAFEVIRDGAATPMAEAQYCPNWCPDKGPAMELDCMPPAPAMLRLAPGATLQIRWSGEVALPYAKSCESGPPRVCLEKAAAPAGRYRARICAYRAAVDGAPAPDSAGKMARATPAGDPSCTEVEFDLPAASPVRALLK